MRPDYFDAAHNLASTFEALGKLAQAEEQYKIALGMQPTDTGMCDVFDSTPSKSMTR